MVGAVVLKGLFAVLARNFKIGWRLWRWWVVGLGFRVWGCGFGV